MVKTSWDESNEDDTFASDATQEVTTTEADLLGPVYGPNLVDVGGIITGDAAYTAKLMGSMDGTNFVQDGSDVSVTTDYARFDFSSRWRYYKVRGATGAGTATADIQLGGRPG